MLEVYRALPKRHRLASGATIEPDNNGHPANWAMLNNQDRLVILGFDPYKDKTDPIKNAEEAYPIVNAWLREHGSSLDDVAWRYSKSGGIHVLAGVEQRWTGTKAKFEHGVIDVITSGSYLGSHGTQPFNLPTNNDFQRTVNAYEWVHDGRFEAEHLMPELSVPRVGTEHVAEWTPTTVLTGKAERAYKLFARQQTVPQDKGGRQDAIYLGARRVGEHLAEHGEATARQAMRDFVESHIANITEPWALDWDAFLRSNRGLLQPLTNTTNPDDTLDDLLANVRCAADITTEPLLLTWDNRLVVGALNSLIGMEGIGKSLLLTHLAAQTSRGHIEHIKPTVLFLAQEDDISRVVIPRLVAAGADLANIQVIDTLNLPKDVSRLERLVKYFDAGLVILDPLSSVLGGTLDANRENEVRAVLDPLTDLAQDTGVTVITNGHLNKDTGSDIRNRAIGSRAFMAIPRSVLACLEHGDTTLLGQAKQNYGKAPIIEYRIESRVFERDGHTHDVGVVVWGNDVDIRMSEIGKPPPQHALCGDWLVAYLSDPDTDKTSSAIKECAKEEGFTDHSLRTARKNAGVLIEKVGMPAKTYWHLPDVDFEKETAA